MKKWTGWKGVGWGERSGPGGKEWAGGDGVGRGDKSRPGGKASAGGKGVGRGGEEVGRGGLGCCTLYIPTSKIFYSIF